MRPMLPPVSTPVEVGTSGSIQDAAISGLSSGWPDLSEELLARVGSARSTLPSDRYLSGSLDLPAESLTRGGSAVSTVPVDRVTLDLVFFAELTMFFEVVRLVFCFFGDGSKVLLRGDWKITQH